MNNSTTVGRPTVCTDEAKARIIELMRSGMTIADTLLAVGVSDRSFRRAKVADKAFAAAVKAATAEFKKVCIQGIGGAGSTGSWQAFAWLLERKFPAEFCQRKPGFYTQEEVIEAAALFTRVGLRHLQPESHEGFHRDLAAALADLERNRRRGKLPKPSKT